MSLGQASGTDRRAPDKPRLRRSVLLLRRVLLFACIGVAAAVLLGGWALDIAALRTLLRGAPPMQPATAALVAALAAVLLLPVDRGEAAISPVAARGLALGVALAALVAVVANVWAPQESGPHLWWRPPPVASALSLKFISIAALLICADLRWTRTIGTVAVIALLFPLVRLLSWLLDPGAAANTFFDGMALHAAACCAVLGIAGVLLHPRLSFVDLLCEDSVVGHSMRLAVPVVVIGPCAVAAVVAASQPGARLPLIDALSIAAVASALALTLLALLVLRTLADTHQAALQQARRLAQSEQRTEAVATRERFLRTIADGVPGMIGYWDTELRCRFANRAYVEWFGLTPEQMQGRAVQDVLGPQLFAHNEALMRAALAGEEQRFERSIARADGRTGHVLAHYIPDLVNGRVQGFFALVTDITAVREREDELLRLYENLESLVAERTAELSQSAQRFEQLFEQSPVGHLVVASDGAILAANAAAAAIFDYPRDALIGRSVDTLLPERLRAGHAQRRASLTLQGERRDMGAEREIFGLRRDGSEVRLDIGLMTLADADGMRVLVTLADVTERERTLAQLRLLAAIVESSGVAVVGKTLDGTVTSWNRGAEALFGFSRDEMLGASIHRIVPETLHDDEAELIRRVSAGETVQQHGTARRHKDGRTLDVLLTMSPVHDARHGIIGISTIAADVSEQKRMAAELARHSRDLERSNAALEQFAWAASHDLQEPLRMVASYVQLIQRRYRERLDEDGLRMMDFAVDGARRMHELVNGLLAYARLRPTEEDARAHLGHTLRDAMRLLGGQIGDEQAQIDTPDLEQAPQVRVAPPSVTQLWQNLLHNALKYRSEETPRIVIAWTAEPDFVHVTVQDNGIGIQPRYHQRVFQIFARLEGGARRDGTGVGLALCKRVVDSVGGEIWVESQGSGGSCFHVRLPTVAGTNPGERA